MHSGTISALSFLRLGYQCPYVLWFRAEAQLAAEQLGSALHDVDLTGRPDLAAGTGAYCSMQVAVSGCPLLTAPRPAAALIEQLRSGARPMEICEAAPAVSAASAGQVTCYRRGDPDWPAAVEATVRLCLPEPSQKHRAAEAVQRKLEWLDSLPCPESGAGLPPLVFLAGTADGAVAFAELIPAEAAPVPLPYTGPGDLYLTCVHAPRGEAGDPRAGLLGRALEALEPLPPLFSGASGVWAVSGRCSPYPNGPLPLFLAEGFQEVAGLGRMHLPGRGWDEMVLVHWRPEGGRERGAAVGIMIHAGDNVVTLPNGGLAGDRVIAHGLGAPVRLVADIPPGHKVAATEIRQGEQVTKYGQSIGAATADIPAGQHVHIHNLRSMRAGGSKPATAVGGADR